MCTDRDAALEFLGQHGGGRDESGARSAMLGMLQSGYLPGSDPLLKATLNVVSAGHLRELKQRARILVPEGRLLLGVMDEFGVVSRRCWLTWDLLFLPCCVISRT